MESREARAQAPTADAGIPMVHEFHAALVSGGRDEPPVARVARMYRVMEMRKDEITMTLLHMLPPGDPVAYIMNNLLLGMRWNKDMERDELNAAPPLHDTILLQSLRTSCPECQGNKCGRKGKFHDITYKRAPKPGSGHERNMMVAMGGTADFYALCKVDPETGLFELDPFEAKMVLRQYGEHAVRATRRWVDRKNQKGDRWKVREVRHHELYGNASLDGSPASDIKPMVDE